MKRSIVRFTLSERLQHIFLLVSLLILALTGLSLMFHDTVWGRWLIDMEGGLKNRGLIHRWAAGVLIAVALYHHFYTLLSERGHRLLRDFLLQRGDLGKARDSIRSNLRGDSPTPQWGKFTFFQKVQYFGVMAGVISMIISGVILWMGPPAIALVPRWLMDLTLLIHGREGLLIFLILLFWHLYNVHLAPGNFPMNMSWLTGRISAQECQERYPAEYRRLVETGEISE